MALGYIGRHWRGELTLPVSFWVNNVLLAFPAGLAIGALAMWIAVSGDFLRGGSRAILVAWPLLLAFSVWSAVGAWRAASAYAESGGSGAWSGLTKLVLALGLLNTAASTLMEFVPNVPDYLRMARGIDPIGHVQATLSPDGRRLRLTGPLGLGDGERVAALAGQSKAVRVVELDSPGGRLKEGAEIAALVREAKWHTRTVGQCESACTLIHMAGHRRQLMPGAKLGFHRASSGTLNPALDRLANVHLAAVYREAGLNEHFLARTLATPPHGMWYPGRDELVHAGLLSVPERPLDLELPAEKHAGVPEYVEALHANDTWLAIERRFPGTLARAAARMQALRHGGGEDEAVQLEAQAEALQHVPALLAGAGPEIREMYLGLITEQLQAARQQGGPQCLAVLALDGPARRALGSALARREATWLVDATQEPVRERGPRTGPSTIEQEVMRRRLGERSPELLAALWQPGVVRPARDPARECDRTLELLAAVAKLPGAERRLALRLVFEVN